MSEKHEINAVVRNLATAINFEVDGKGVATGDNKAYLNGLGEALERHHAYEKVGKKVATIVGDEEKAGKVMSALYDNGEEVLRGIHAYDAEFFAAVALGLGEAAEAAIKGNSELNRVTGQVTSVGRNNFSATYDHTYVKRVPGAKGEPVTCSDAYGRVNVSHDVYGNRKSAAQLIAVREHLAELANAGLAD